MQYVKLFEHFVLNELADSSKLYKYRMSGKVVEDAQLWQAFFTTDSGIKYTCSMLDSDQDDKNILRNYCNKISHGDLKKGALNKVSNEQMRFYEVNFKTTSGTYSDLVGKGEMPSVVSTCFHLVKKVLEQEDAEMKVVGFYFTGTSKDVDAETTKEKEKEKTQRTRIYRYYISKIFTGGYKFYEEGNMTKVLLVKN